MMCFAWNPTSCYKPGDSPCPPVSWFWALAAGAGLLLLLGNKKANGR